jgi:hypothetical protein
MTTRTSASPSWQKVFAFLSQNNFCTFPRIRTEQRAVHNLDFWTSGTQKDCPGKLAWCSLDRPVRSRNLSWASTSDGDCVSVKYGPNATSTFTKTACDKQLLYICEVYFLVFTRCSLLIKNIQVHNKGTFAQALQAECMAVWDISIGTKFLYFLKKNQFATDLNSRHVAFRHQGLQRLNYAQKSKGFNSCSLNKLMK